MYTLGNIGSADSSPVVAFFAVGLLRLLLREPLAGAARGVALGLFTTYKPSLIAIPAAMDDPGRHAGGCSLDCAAAPRCCCLGSLATAGVNGLRLWMIQMKVFSTASPPRMTNHSPDQKYVDLEFFLQHPAGRKFLGGPSARTGHDRGGRGVPIYGVDLVAMPRARRSRMTRPTLSMGGRANLDADDQYLPRRSTTPLFFLVPPGRWSPRSLYARSKRRTGGAASYG